MFPKAAVVLPCRGLEHGLEEHIRALLAQAYPDFELLLTTTADDLSLPLLRRMEAEASEQIRVVLAPQAKTSAQKLVNQLAAVKTAAPGTEVLVFVDSDGCVPSHFLREMIRPLADPTIGLVTGWRWYLPEPGRFWSYVRSAWNAGTFPFLVDQRHNIAFGGAMAVRREVFEKSGVAKWWEQALSDGLSLARAVKEMGLRVKFVPRCIAVSREGGSFRDVLEWTNRHATISHVYMPEFWRFTATAHTLSILVLVLTLVAGGLTAGAWGVAAAAGLYTLLLEWNAFLTLRTACRMLPVEIGTQLWCMRGRYLAAAPFAVWLYGVNILRSWCSRTIQWRGITYRLVSPTQTEIVSRKDEAPVGELVIHPAP